jgi:hypothetical protein
VLKGDPQTVTYTSLSKSTIGNHSLSGFVGSRTPFASTFSFAVAGVEEISTLLESRAACCNRTNRVSRSLFRTFEIAQWTIKLPSQVEVAAGSWKGAETASRAGCKR